MIILAETGGQTCNKFFQYLFYLKYCIKRDEKLLIQLPDKTIEEYPNLIYNQYIGFPFYSHWLTKKIGIKKSYAFTRWLTVLFLNNYIRPIIHHLSFKKLNFVSGKPTWTGTNETYDDITPVLNFLFEPREDLKKSVDTFFQNNDATDVICGIHIRGGDYRKWLNGKYFFEQEVYQEAMDKLQSLIPDKRIKFFICSNEPLKKEIFEKYDYFQIDHPTVSQDIYALSKCDLMIGTLSSFNAWASLIGSVPLYTILCDSDVRDLSLDQFSPVINYKVKKNGWTFPRSKTFYSKVSHPWLYRHSNTENTIDLEY